MSEAEAHSGTMLTALPDQSSPQQEGGDEDVYQRMKARRTTRRGAVAIRWSRRENCSARPCAESSSGQGQPILKVVWRRIQASGKRRLSLATA